MPDESKRKAGGGKLSRSETVTVRLDPKLRYLASLAARKQRRTLSSFIEWAVERVLREVDLGRGSIAEEAYELWDVEEADRFVLLALHAPDLLTFEEQQLWKALVSSGLLSAVSPLGEGTLLVKLYVLPVLRDLWPELMRVRTSPTRMGCQGSGRCRQRKNRPADGRGGEDTRRTKG